MGSGNAGGSNAENGSASRDNNNHSPSSDIPFEHFRYSPKLTNYTGEPAKTPQEIKAIQDLQVRRFKGLSPAIRCVSSVAVPGPSGFQRPLTRRACAEHGGDRPPVQAADGRLQHRPAPVRQIRHEPGSQGEVLLSA